ncbi:hypothetical protein [Agromyces sp. NPDC058110]|uniref:hypothetical protein n=1 Tax=Agromyces sp. NPDC058110 TaxID=3346345 RepID=UPI0036DDEE59
MDFLLMGVIVVLVLAAISVTGSLRAMRESSERTADATEELLELERSRHSMH